MARRRQGTFEDLAGLPWPVGVAVGVLSYLAIRYGAPWFLIRYGGTLGQAFSNEQITDSLNWLAWMVLGGCWLAAGVAYFKQLHRRRLYESQAARPELAALDWREFELVVGEWFRRQGYSVEETGGGGKDGGIDVAVRKEGRRELVQCKHWKRKKVDVATVREMWGLLQHHRADAVWIVCCGQFTADAARFAAGKPIHLVSGQQLEQVIGSAPSRLPPAGQAPAATHRNDVPPCRKCGSPMAERQNRKTGETFLGCTAFPRCRETAPVAPGG